MSSPSPRGPAVLRPRTAAVGPPHVPRGETVPARPPCLLADAARVLGASRHLPPRTAGLRPPFVLPPTPLARSRPRPAPGCLPDTPPGGFRGSRRFPPSRLAAAGAEVARRDPVDPAHEFLSARVRRRGSPRACAAGRPGVSPRECAARLATGTALDVRVTSGYTMGGCLPGFGPRFLPLVSCARSRPRRGVWPVVCRGRGRSRRPDGRPFFPHARELSPSLRHPVPRARGDAEVVREGWCCVTQGRREKKGERGGPGETKCGGVRSGWRSRRVSLPPRFSPSVRTVLPVSSRRRSSLSFSPVPRLASVRSLLRDRKSVV